MSSDVDPIYVPHVKGGDLVALLVGLFFLGLLLAGAWLALMEKISPPDAKLEEFDWEDAGDE